MAKDTIQKILEAAFKVFGSKGFAATRMRDIADEAGVNLALINYHFKSKEELFKTVMSESIDVIQHQFIMFMDNPDNTMKEKLVNMMDAIARLMIDNNELFVFVFNEMSNNPDFTQEFLEPFKHIDTVLYKQYNEAGLTDRNIADFFVNIFSLLIGPLVGKTVIMQYYKFDESQFSEFLEDRRRKIPQWVDFLVDHYIEKK